MGHMTGVKSRGNRQLPCVQPPLLTFLDHLADPLGVPTHHHLVRRVVVTHDHTREGREDVGDLLACGLDRRHRTRVVFGIVGRWRHRLTTGAREAEKVRVGQRASRPQGGQLPETVSEETRTAQAQLGQIPELPDRERTDSRLRVFGLAKSCLLRLALARVKDGYRVDDRGQTPRRPGERAVRIIEGGRHGRNVERRLHAHVQILAALPGEQRADLQVRQLPAPEEHPGRMRPLLHVPGRRELIDRQCAQALRRLVVGGHEPDPGMPGGNRRRLLPRRTRTQHIHQCAGVRRMPQIRPSRPMQRFDGATIPVVLLQHDMEVRPAEPHRGRGRPPHRPIRVTNPRPGAGVDVQRRVSKIDRAVRALHIDRRGQHLLIQRQRELHHTRRTGRTLGVPDL